MTEMLETQEATVDESFDDTGFLEDVYKRQPSW